MPDVSFFGPYFCAKLGFLDPKILKNMIFSEIMVLGATTASTQKHTHSCCFLNKKRDFFFGFFRPVATPSLGQQKYVFLQKS